MEGDAESVQKWPACPVCDAAVTPTEPVGPPTADHRLLHLRCWIKKRRNS